MGSRTVAIDVLSVALLSLVMLLMVLLVAQALIHRRDLERERVERERVRSEAERLRELLAVVVTPPVPPPSVPPPRKRSRPEWFQGVVGGAGAAVATTGAWVRTHQPQTMALLAGAAAVVFAVVASVPVPESPDTRAPIALPHEPPGQRLRPEFPGPLVPRPERPREDAEPEDGTGVPDLNSEPGNITAQPPPVETQEEPAPGTRPDTEPPAPEQPPEPEPDEPEPEPEEPPAPQPPSEEPCVVDVDRRPLAEVCVVETSLLPQGGPDGLHQGLVDPARQEPRRVGEGRRQGQHRPRAQLAVRQG